MHLQRLILWLTVLCCGLPRVGVAQDLRFFELPTSLLNPIGAGARAAGKGFAFIGVADDATAASHNPGGLAQLERPEISVVGSYFLQVEDPASNAEIESQTLDTISLNFLSVVFPPFQLLERKVVASIQVQRPFELDNAVDFTGTSPDVELNFRRDGRLFNISPAVAVRITPTFSVGVAFNIWPDVFNNGWKTDTTLRIGSGETRSESDFSFEGFNVTAGFLWQITSTLTLGGVFRSPFNATVTHNNVTEGSSFKETLTMEMPLSYGLGLSARLSDLLTVSLDVSWVKWSDFRLDTPASSFFLSTGGLDVVVSPDFRAASRGDTTSVRLGMEYLWLRPDGPVIPLRAGLFYDPEPSFQGINHFFGFSLGAGIVAGPFLLDIAYTFRAGSRTKLVVRTDDPVVDTVEEKDTDVYEHNILTSVIFHF